MIDIIYLFFLFLLVVVFLFIIRSDFLVEKHSVNCDSSFLVLDGKSSQYSAEILCEISKRLDILELYFEQNKDPRYIKEIDEFLRNYNKRKLVESSDSAYTINKAKGKLSKIHICLMNENNYIDLNTVMFVVLHEITHVMILSSHIFDDHPADFWHLNKWLLGEAEKAKIFTNIDYRFSPVNYCGKDINVNPYFMDIYKFY